MTSHNFFKPILLCLFILSLSSCSTTSTVNKERAYSNSAKNHKDQAEYWESIGNKGMAEYHREKSVNARHNQYASGCGMFEFILFDLLLSSDTCDHKN